MSAFSFWVHVTQNDIDRFRAGEISCPVATAMKRAGLKTFRTSKVRVYNGNLQVWTTNSVNGYKYWESWYPSTRGRLLARRCQTFRKYYSKCVEKFEIFRIKPTRFVISEV